MNQVGRYQIQGELKRDPSGAVYKGLDPALGRTVAIKSIRLADVTDPGERRRTSERLLTEARAAGTLSHPNIVAIYDLLEQDDFAYILMEYVEGRSLEQMLQEGSIPTAQPLLEMLRQIADALDYAHRKGIVHRDIRPANILIVEASPGSESIPKIAEFGIAKLVADETTHNAPMAAASSYMSPEQIQDMVVDARSDQFSFAVVIYELLTRTKPFSASQLPALFYAICKQDPPPANQLNPALSEATGKVLQRALMKDPEQRFSSCGEFMGALSIALAEAPQSEPATLSAAPEAPLVIAAAASERPRSSVPVISIPDAHPDDRPFELPTRVRRHREEEDVAAEPRRTRSSGFKKLALILVMFFAIAVTIIFIVLSNSGPTVPVQVLDTRSGPMTPPPEGMEVKNQPPAAKQSAPAASTPLRHRQEPAPSETRPIAGSTPAAVPSARNYMTDVELLSEPPGASMVVDGRSDLTCNAPCTLNLPNGRHTVTADLAGFNLGRRIFNVPDDNSLFVNLSKSMGVLLVTSTHSGCEVLVDGRQSGYTPATLHLTTGSHRVAVLSRTTRHEETVQVQTDGFDVEKFICQ